MGDSVDSRSVPGVLKQPVDVLVLGPVGVRRGDELLVPSAGLTRALIGVLGLAGRRGMSAATLTESVWGVQVPETPRSSLMVAMHRARSWLRRHVGDEVRIERTSTGYVLVPASGEVDAARFVRLVGETHGSVGEERVRVLTQALDLWRGDPLADVKVRGDMDSGVAELLRARRQATVDLGRALLEMGRSAQAVDAVAHEAERYPLDEQLQAVLIEALAASDGQAEALGRYERLRQRLADELGVSPGRELTAALQRVLRQEPPGTTRHDAGDDDVRRVAPPATAPRELPPDVLGFTGRVAQLAELDRLRAFVDERASAVVISAIDGMAGVGKTALAVHAAHRLVDQYPDGQLFVDLHGYTPDVPPVEPAAALDQMLRSLGIPGERVPMKVQERAAMLRTRLAGRRVLVVLDNAAADTQVRPLLPGTPGCLVLVTSRTRLTGLDDALPLSLDVLSVRDAVALFTQAVGERRCADADAGVVEEIITLCGRLPLAIRIAAARLRHRPTWTPHHLAELLGDQRGRLAELEAGQLSVTTALGVSYAQLTTEQQRMFRLLGLHHGADIDPYAAAALTRTTLADARRVLEQLLDVHLLIQRAPGRYAFHDLVRAYATERSHAGDTESGRRAALTRLFDHYAHTATVAMDTVYPYEADQRPHRPAPETPIPDLHAPTAAQAWLAAELDNLLATAHAGNRDSPGHTTHLSATLHPYLRTRARYAIAETLHHHAHTLARGAGDRAGELTTLNALGDIHHLQGRYERAVDCHGQALEIARNTGDREGELTALNGLGHVCRLQGRHERAVDCHGQALEIARDTGDREGELTALNGLGQVRYMQGRYEQAVDYLWEALELAQDAGDRTGKRAVLTGLGYVHLPVGRYERSVDYFGRALEIAQETGNRNGEVHALTGLGIVHRLLGRYERAMDHFGRAQEIAQQTGNRHGEILVLIGFGHVYRELGRHERAVDHFRRALEIAQVAGNRNSQFETHLGLGRVRTATGDHDQAITHHHIALALATEIDQPQDQARAHDGLAGAYHATGQHDLARNHWQAALNILTAKSIDHTADAHVTSTTLRARLAGLEKNQATAPAREGPHDARCD